MFKYPYLLLVPLTLAIIESALAVTRAELYRPAAHKFGRFEARIQFAGGVGVMGSFFLWKEKQNLASVGGGAVLALTADDATGYSGDPPADPPGTGGLSSTGEGGWHNGCGRRWGAPADWRGQRTSRSGNRRGCCATSWRGRPSTERSYELGKPGRVLKETRGA